jgi:transposase
MPCPSNKKPFPTEVDAVAFEQKNRTLYNCLQQYAYACEDCPDWHLKTTPPGVSTMAVSHLGQATVSDESLITVPGEELYRLRESGLNIKDIAARFNLREQTVYNRITKYKLQAGITTPVKRYQPVTLDQVSQKKLELEQQQKELQEKIDEMARVEARLAEAQRMKFTYGPEGYTIRKKHEQITLSLEDMAALLSDYMDRKDSNA